MNKKILNLAIPNILSNLAIPMLSAVDTAVVGHLDKISYLGAIAIGSMIFNFIYWAFGFLRMGTTGMTAQAHGAENKNETASVLGRAALVAVASAIVLVVFQNWIGDLSFYLVDGTPEVELFARQYFNIRIYAAPATLGLYAFHGWFLGMQNAKYPMILAISINVINVILNLLFIYQFGMKSEGVALGTVIAQYSGLILAIILFMRKYPDYLPRMDIQKILDIKKAKEFFSINLDIFIRTLALVFAFTFFTAKSAEFGDNLLAVNTILMQLWMILAYGVDGFAFAAESLVGKYIGAGNSFSLKKVIKLSFIWALGLAFLTSIVYLLFQEPILRIFTDKPEIISAALVFIIYVIVSPPINSICFIWDGVYIGATATAPMRNAMVISTLFFFLLPFYFLTPIWGNHGLWIALTLFMISRGVGLSLLAPKNIYRKLK